VSSSSSIRVFPKDARLESKALIAGFHGIGATGFWSVKFLIQELHAERLCYIDSEFAPAVSSTVNGEISTPYEIFEAGRLVFLKADVPPLRDNENRFFRELSEWITGSGVEEVCLIGGLDESLRTDESMYRIVTTSKMKERATMNDEKILEEGRVIVGPVAIMLNALEMRNAAAYALLSYSNTERVDPRAAATAVQFIAKRYNLQIDTLPLIKGAEELEREMSTMAEKEREKERSTRSAIYS
jgi:uncharacterized protein